MAAPFSSSTVETGYSVDSQFSSDTGFYDGAMPNYEAGVPVDGMPIDGNHVDGMPIDGGYDPGSAAPYYDNDLNSGSSLLDDGSSPPPPLPGPSDDDSAMRSQPKSNNAAILSVSLPTDAEVYINGKRTKTEGDVRNYVSRRLQSGQSQPCLVKAVIHRDGKRLVRTRTVALTAGEVSSLKLDFDQPATTLLAVTVPENATVRLCGSETSAKGEQRFFETNKLADGETWKDYEIEVVVERDGKSIVTRRSLTLVAGETHNVSFDLNDQTGQLVASK
jgi:uncharacterized protein (TIGR03000 family)